MRNPKPCHCGPGEGCVGPPLRQGICCKLKAHDGLVAALRAAKLAFSEAATCECGESDCSECATDGLVGDALKQIEAALSKAGAL